MTDKEIQSAKKQEDAVSENTAKRLNLCLALVKEKFNLDDTYTIRQFSDKGKVVNLTLENKEFSVSVTIKDSGRHGLVVDI